MTMNPNSKPSVVGSQWPVAGARAFTLIEIMVTVGLLTFIILGLMAMFHQTQRAFRTGMTQSDVLEAGRSLADMWQRELPEMAPAQSPWTTNFLAEVAPPVRFGGDPLTGVMAQNLPPYGNQAQQRTNLFYDFFFLTHENQTWTGIGYMVDTPTNGVATLYRWQMSTNTFNDGFALLNCSSNFDNTAWALYLGNTSFLAPLATNANPSLKRVASGVVNLRVKCYGPNGALLMPTLNYPQYSFIYTNLALPQEIRATEADSFFTSNAVPAFVEIEIGFLEDRTLAHYRAIPDPKAQRQYLADHSAQVHLFRQRIPIRNVDPTAYAVSQ
jgi:hypothetical protein